VDLLGHQPAKASRDEGYLPQGHVVQSQQRGNIVPPKDGDLVLVDAVEPELVGQTVGNADEPAEAVGERAVEVEDDQLESQGTLSVGGCEG
jgi:hypothetical protein